LIAILALDARGSVPAPLESAVRTVFENFDRWAYTQTIVERDDKNHVRTETVVRFDPSKPYGDQFTPLSIDGKPPTREQIKKYRQIGEKRADQIEKAEREGLTPAQKTVGELMDIEHAVPLGETADAIDYEVPLKREGNNRLPPDKFQVVVRVNKVAGGFDSIRVQLKKPMRTEVVVKIKSGQGHLQFATVDPKYPPLLTKIRGDGRGSVLFVPIGRKYEVTRTDFLRVKPYGDRFSVKFGPLKTLDF
jgi:hypothetical protein